MIFNIGSRMPQDELDKYYEQRRKIRYEAGKGPGMLWWRMCLHPILLLGIKVERLLRKERLVVIGDMRTKTDRPKIYASTHIGGHDVESCFEAIGEHAFLFIGDPRELYRNFDGLMLFLNGMICLETRSKNDRRIAKENAVSLLKKRGNLLIYPEGVWNISENLLVNPIYMGTASMAQKSGADIIPMAIEQYGNTFYVNIGENIDSREWNKTQIPALTEYLRNQMATLKWEILEQNGVKAYDTVTEKLRYKWVDSIFARADYSYTVQDVYETQYRTKEQIEQEEAFAFVHKLIPSRDNAFLLKWL